MKATQQLKEEHESIQLMCNVMEKISTGIGSGNELNTGHYDKIIDYINGFTDKCHHGKEEDILVPAMLDHGIPNDSGPIAILLNLNIEHQLCRSHIKILDSALNKFKKGNKQAVNSIISSSRNYVELIRKHIDKENRILFLMADKILNEATQLKLFDAFKKLEVEKIGAGRHKDYLQILNELKGIYL